MDHSEGYWSKTYSQVNKENNTNDWVLKYAQIGTFAYQSDTKLAKETLVYQSVRFLSLDVVG